MGRPKLKDERKRRVSMSITIRKDLKEYVESSMDGYSKTIENSIRSSREIKKLLDMFYEERKKECSKESLLELIEDIDDALSLFASSFEETIEEEENHDSQSGQSGFSISAKGN